MWRPILLSLVLLVVSGVQAYGYDSNIDGIDDFQVSKTIYDPLVSAFAHDSDYNDDDDYSTEQPPPPTYDSYEFKIDGIDDFKVSKTHYDPVISAIVSPKDEVKLGHDAFKGRVKNTETISSFKARNKYQSLDDSFRGLVSSDHDDHNDESVVVDKPIPDLFFESFEHVLPQYQTNEEDYQVEPIYETQEEGKQTVAFDNDSKKNKVSRRPIVPVLVSDFELVTAKNKVYSNNYINTTKIQSEVSDEVDSVNFQDNEESLQFAVSPTRYSKKTKSPTSDEEVENDDSLQFVTPIRYAKKLAEAPVVWDGDEIKFVTPISRVSHSDVLPPVNSVIVEQGPFYVAPPSRQSSRKVLDVNEDEDDINYVTPLPRTSKASFITESVKDVQFVTPPVRQVKNKKNVKHVDKEKYQYVSLVNQRGQKKIVKIKPEKNVDSGEVNFVSVPDRVIATLSVVEEEDTRDVQFVSPISRPRQPHRHPASSSPKYVQQEDNFEIEFENVPVSKKPNSAAFRYQVIPAPAIKESESVKFENDVVTKYNGDSAYVEFEQEDTEINYVSAPRSKHAPSRVHNSPVFAAPIVAQNEDNASVKYAKAPSRAAQNDDNNVVVYVTAPPRIPDSPVFAAPIAVQKNGNSVIKYSNSRVSISPVQENDVTTLQHVLPRYSSSVISQAPKSQNANIKFFDSPTNQRYTAAPRNQNGGNDVAAASPSWVWTPSTTPRSPLRGDIPEVAETAEPVISIDWNPKDAPCFGRPNFARVSTGVCKRHYVKCHESKAISQFCGGLFEVFSNETKSCVAKALAAECKPAFPSKARQSDEGAFISTLSEASFCLKRVDGIYRHPRNCSRIVQCFGEHRFEYPSCAHNLAFDESTGSCNYRDQVQGCESTAINTASVEPQEDSSSSVETQTSTVALVRNTSSSAVVPTVMENPIASGSSSLGGCNGRSHGDHIPNIDDCSKFFRCVWDRLVPMNCPATTVFNPKLGVCDYPDRVDCSALRKRARF